MENDSKRATDRLNRLIESASRFRSRQSSQSKNRDKPSYSSTKRKDSHDNSKSGSHSRKTQAIMS